MRYHLLKGQINPEIVKETLDFICDHKGHLTVAIDSHGGEKAYADMLLFALNQNKDRVTLIAIAGVASCAFDIFYGFQGVRKMAFGCMGMTHYSSRNIDTHSNGEAAYAEGDCHKKNLKAYKEYELFILRKFATEKEIKRFKKSWDVYFSFKRMQQIFPDAEII